MTKTRGEFLRVEDLTKSFGRVRANDGVSLSFNLGEIHSLLGENGAGKSTLIKILAGVYQPDAGAIYTEGQAQSIRSPADSRRLGISVVHQRLELIPTLSVIDNVVLQEAGLGRINRREIGNRAQAVADRLGFTLDLRAKVGSLSVGARQRVEIVRALLAGGRLVILDEPTTILAPGEAAALFGLLKGLAEHGSAVVFVTHRLKEAIAHSDRVTILRQGRVVGRFGPDDELREEELVRMMVGDFSTSTGLRTAPPGSGFPEVLSIKAVTGAAPSGVRLAHIGLSLRQTEILGVAGVEGNGQADLAALVCGMWDPEEGTVLLDGRPLLDYSPAERGRLVADIPDSMTLAMAGELTVWENLGLRTMAWHARPSVRTRAQLREQAREQVAKFDIRTTSIETPVSMLSGGNQQRTIVARELSAAARVIVAAYPTRGLDVRSAALVKRWIRDLAQKGAGVVFISSDLEEIFDMSDRVAVMFHGRVVAVLDTARTTIGEVGQYMVGGAPNE